MGAETECRGKFISTAFTTGFMQDFHGNDADDLLQRGHACLELFQCILLQSAHPGGSSRNSNQVGFKCPAQN
jgi:hypothetical protein